VLSRGLGWLSVVLAVDKRRTQDGVCGSGGNGEARCFFPGGRFVTTS
jgi:hypothetical protein